MHQEQKMVLALHKKFQLPIHEKPTIISDNLRKLRIDLIDEEAEELNVAMKNQDMEKIADGLADLLYVVHGTAISYGLDMKPIFIEVHRSNMSKGDPEIIRRDDGKVLKGKNWSPPDLLSIIKNQSSARRVKT